MSTNYHQRTIQVIKEFEQEIRAANDVANRSDLKELDDQIRSATNPIVRAALEGARKKMVKKPKDDPATLRKLVVLLKEAETLMAQDNMPSFNAFRPKARKHKDD